MYSVHFDEHFCYTPRFHVHQPKCQSLVQCHSLKKKKKRSLKFGFKVQGFIKVYNRILFVGQSSRWSRSSDLLLSVMEDKEAERTGGAPPRLLLDHTAACCHGGANMALLAYSLGKREINQHFTIRNAKLISLLLVTLLLVLHATLRYSGGERARVTVT